MKPGIEKSKETVLKASQKPLELVNKGLEMSLSLLLSFIIVCYRHKLTSLAVLTASQIALHAPELMDMLEEKLYADTLEAEVERNARILKIRYGVNLAVGLSEESKENLDIDGSSTPTLPQQARASRWILEELSQYPSEIITQIGGLQRITLANDLLHQDRMAGGVANHTEFAIQPGWNGAVAYFDRTIFTYVFHHEFGGHILDHARNNDEAWNSLNKHGGARYFYSEGNCSPVERAFFYWDGHDFVTCYAMKSPSEDKAETTALLYSAYNRLVSKAEKSEAIRSKVEFRQLILYTLSLGLMDEGYWTHIQNGTLTPAYFEEKREELKDEKVETRIWRIMGELRRGGKFTLDDETLDYVELLLYAAYLDGGIDRIYDTNVQPQIDFHGTDTTEWQRHDATNVVLQFPDSEIEQSGGVVVIEPKWEDSAQDLDTQSSITVNNDPELLVLPRDEDDDITLLNVGGGHYALGIPGKAPWSGYVCRWTLELSGGKGSSMVSMTCGVPFSGPDSNDSFQELVRIDQIPRARLPKALGIIGSMQFKGVIEERVNAYNTPAE